jgi:hypothetical protein
MRKVWKYLFSYISAFTRYNVQQMWNGTTKNIFHPNLEYVINYCPG